MKSNPKVIAILLNASRRIESSLEGLGIMFENKNVKHHILKVCNPHCGPCAKAYPLLDTLFENGEIDLQILFTANAERQDYRAKPVSHFMAIYNKSGKRAAQKALNQWYTAKTKNHEVFTEQYPMNGELKEQCKSLEAMVA